MSRHLSPTAQLLRSSRLFSLPQPLPRPIVENQAENLSYRTSDTATTPFPTHQAISTPDSSLRRGDWGFKRPLPVRETSSEIRPFVRTVARLTNQDTIEHITDYQTASDHTKTWEKFQEMRIAQVRKDLKTGTLGEHKSAFEPAYDYTDKKSAPSLGDHADNTPRWKFEGSSLGQMTQRDFNNFVTKKVHRRGDEFDIILRAEVTRIYVKKRRDEALKELQEGQSDDTAALIKLDYLNRLCQLSDQGFKEYREHLMELLGNAKDKESSKPGMLSCMDELSAQNGPEHVKEFLIQRLTEIPEYDFKHILERGPRIPKEHLTVDAQARAQDETSFLAQVEQALHFWIPSNTLLRPLPTKREFRALSQAESSVRLANIFVVEWQFMTRYNLKFEQAYAKWLTEMRGNITSTSPLNKRIREVLDIAPLFARNIKNLSDGTSSESFSTHPSAGLSYLRTNSYLDNHPILGPQAIRTPAEARVLSPRSMDARGKVAHLGIGGFVVQESTSFTGAHDRDNNLAKLDPEADGGVKIPLEVPFASVDRWGSVKLHTQRPRSKDPVEIKGGALIHPINEKWREMRQSTSDPGRFTSPLDSRTPFQTAEAKKQSASITNLLGMLNAKKKEQEQEA